MKYFITGLPRSRTAWLSVFMSSGDSYCHHEASRGCNNIYEFDNKLHTGHKATGNSDCALALLPILKYYPDSPIVIIDRDTREVCQSLEKIGLYNPQVHRSLVEAKWRMSRLKGMVVRFEEINEALEDIWKYLTKLPYDKHRESLKDLKITTTDYSVDIDAINNLMRTA